MRSGTYLSDSNEGLTFRASDSSRSVTRQNSLVRIVSKSEKSLLNPSSRSSLLLEILKEDENLGLDDLWVDLVVWLSSKELGGDGSGELSSLTCRQPLDV